jgi:hypothetical protein
MPEVLHEVFLDVASPYLFLFGLAITIRLINRRNGKKNA